MAVEDLYAKACEAVERNNLDYAIKLFRQVLVARPDYPDARAALRMTERRRLENKGGGGVASASVDAAAAGAKALIGSARKKLEVYEDFLEKHPNSFWGLANAAAAAAKAGLQIEAIGIYKDALRFKPDDKGALRHISDLLRDTGDSAEAVKYLGHLGSLEPQNRELMEELRDLEAATHMAVHRVDQAASFRDLIRDKDEAARLEEAGRMAVSLDDLHRQIIQQEKELEEHPKQPNRILRLAQLYEDVGEPQKALNLLTQKREVLPDNYEIREELGDVAIGLADAQIAKLEQQASGAPDDAAGKKLAEMRDRRNKYALEELRWRIAQHPTDRELQSRVGRLNYDMGRYNEAIASFQALVPDARLAVEALRMLGLCFMKKAQFDLALEQFNKALERHPEMDDEGKELRYNMAQACEEGGNTEEALKTYKQIYSQDINYRDVAKKVDALSK